MPNIVAGPTITDSTQIATGVVNSGDIANGAIVNEDINAAAAIAGSKLQEISLGVNAGVIPSTGIVNAHIAAGAAIADTKLAQITAASKVNGAALTGLASVPAGAGVIPAANVPAVAPRIASSFSAVDITNTASETTLLTAAIPAGTLGTADGVKLTVFFNAYYGAGQTDIVLRVKYGATTMHTIDVLASPNVPGPCRLEFYLLASGATNAQESFLMLDAHVDALTPTATQTMFLSSRTFGSAAEDSTAAKNLVLTIQPDSAQSNQHVTMQGYIVSKI